MCMITCITTQFLQFVTQIVSVSKCAHPSCYEWIKKVIRSLDIFINLDIIVLYMLVQKYSGVNTFLQPAWCKGQ